MSAADVITVTLDAAGGSVTSLDNRVQLEFGPDALTQMTAIAVTSLSREVNAEGELRFVRFELNAYAVNADGSLGEAITRFARPYTLTLKLNGQFDLDKRDRHIQLVYLDETAGTWSPIPLVNIDRRNHWLTARLDHFSSFGAGATNEYWKLLFNDAQVALFSGAAVYNVPLEAPPGRGGLTPQVNLSYNSARLNGILNWSQSDWAGLGWSVDQVEVVRKVTTDHPPGYCVGDGVRGHKNSFTLLINGSAYKLVPADISQLAGRYYTEEESFLYVVRHNAQDGQASPSNYQGEWWEVRTPDGTLYRIGYNADSEQRISYINTYDDSLGFPCDWGAADLYAGPHTDGSVAYRWRVDQMTDVWGNQVAFTYSEYRRACTNPNVDHASYLATISYNGGNSLITFVRGARGTGGDGGPAYDANKGGYGDTWSNPGCENFYQPDYLSSIQVQHAGVLIREYKLGYSFDGPSGSGWWADWQQRLLTSVRHYGRGGVAGGQALPATTFGYTRFLNHRMWEPCNPGACLPDSYDFNRLTTVANGYGATISLSYVTPNADVLAYYNYFVSRKTVNPGLGVSHITDYAYSNSCYNLNDDPDNKTCTLNDPYGGPFIGHGGVTETLKADNGTSNAALIRHWFHINMSGNDWQRAGREYRTEQRTGEGATLLAATDQLHVSSPVVGSVYFVHTDAVTHTTSDGGVSKTSWVTYTYDLATGARLAQFDHGDASAGNDERSTYWDYSSNTSPGVWILGKVVRESVYAGIRPNDSNTTYLKARTRYRYDGACPFSLSQALTDGALTAVDRWNGGIGGTDNCANFQINPAFVTNGTRYDAWGNPVVITDALGYTTTTKYDGTYHLYPLETSNAKSQVTRSEFYGINGVPDGGYAPGLPKAAIDANNQTTTYTYDAFGRLRKVARPFDSLTYPTVEYQYTDAYSGGGLTGFKVKTIHRETSGSATPNRVDVHFYNGIGQLLQTRAEATDGSQQSVVNTVYDSRGNVVWSYTPAFETTTEGFSRPSGWDTRPRMGTLYDALGRTVTVTNTDGTTTKTAFSGRMTGMLDANGHQRIGEVDAYGQLVMVREFTQTLSAVNFSLTPYATTRYHYDVLGNLVRITDTLSNVTSITYDTLGRKTAMTDPDMGAWDYAYDDAGNLKQQDDAKHQRICFYYDTLHRPVGKYYTNDSTTCATTNPPYVVTYAYDAYDGSTQFGRGARTGMADQASYALWKYDPRGRVTQETKVISGTGGGTFVTQYGYDAMDRVDWMKYPGGNGGQSGEVVDYTYDAASLLDTVVGGATYVQDSTYDAAGRIDLRKLGADVLRQDYVYYPWTTVNGQGRLQQLTTGIPTDLDSLQDLRYTYDAVGNVLTIQDYKAGSPQTQTFHYDELDRLKDAVASGGTGGTYTQETYTYNAVGNILSKAGANYTYNATVSGCTTGTPSPKPHAVSQMGSYTFTYNCNGNMTVRNESGGAYNQTWDEENRLKGITGAAAADFYYDGDGNRVKATVAGVTTVYLGNYYEQSGTVTKTYFYAGGQRIALRQGSTVYFLLGDHLGSTSITANSSGGLYAELRYKPWGEQRYWNGVATPTTFRFTGQREEVGLGSLYFYGARMYSPGVGRFLSADTIVPDGKETRRTPITVDFHEFIAQVGEENRLLDQYGWFFQWDDKVRREHPVPIGPSNPQALNRYAYGLNNSLRHLDPTGHDTLIFEVTFNNERAYAAFTDFVRDYIVQLRAIQAGSMLAAGVLGTGTTILSKNAAGFTSVIPIGYVNGGFDADQLEMVLAAMKPYAAIAFDPNNKQTGGKFTITIEIHTDAGRYKDQFFVYVSVPGRASQLWVPCATRKCGGALFVDALDKALSLSHGSGSNSVTPRLLVYEQ